MTFPGAAPSLMRTQDARTKSSGRYQVLYLTYKDRLSLDSPSGKVPKWMKKLQIIDSTIISLFSNLVFKGVGRNPKNEETGELEKKAIGHHARIVTCIDEKKEVA